MADQLPPTGSLWSRLAACFTLFPERTELPDTVVRTINGEGLSIDAESIRRDWDKQIEGKDA